MRYYRKHSRIPNLTTPNTFSEKVCAAKLRWRDPRLSHFVDKVAAKDIVRRVLGEEWVIPTLYSGPSLPPLHERDWPLPFVIKANHGSGWNLFIRSEAECDWGSIEAQSASWLRRKYGRYSGETPYSYVDPQILIEPLIEDNPNDYKIFVFGGKAEYIQVDTDRFSVHRRTFFDRQWNRQAFEFRYPLDDREIPAPVHLTKMLNAAEELARGFPFVRVDFYEVGSHPYFGEITLFPESGDVRFTPHAVEQHMGDLWPDHPDGAPCPAVVALNKV